MRADRVHEADPRKSDVIPCYDKDINTQQSGGQSDVRQWTIKGLSPDTVEVTREAAKRSGMKLNSWVGMALQRAAETPINSTNSGNQPEAEELKVIKEELARIRAQGEALESTVNSMSALLMKLYTGQSK